MILSIIFRGKLRVLYNSLHILLNLILEDAVGLHFWKMELNLFNGLHLESLEHHYVSDRYFSTLAFCLDLLRLARNSGS